MWACVAAMAMAAKELNTAEVAFAAVDEVDKLHFVLKVRPPACQPNPSPSELARCPRQVVQPVSSALTDASALAPPWEQRQRVVEGASIGKLG